MVFFSEDLDGFSLRLRVEAALSVPRARMLIIEVCSGTEAGTVIPTSLNDRPSDERADSKHH